MEVSENIKRLAKSEGFPEVNHLCSWKEYEVFVAFAPDFPYIGMPQYILASKDGALRWASIDETEEIIQSQS